MLIFASQKREEVIMKVNELLQTAKNPAGQSGEREADPTWVGMLGEIAASGSNYAMSHQAMRLFSALGSDNPHGASAHAAMLADMANERYLLGTRDAATALERALLEEGCCDAERVRHTCADLIEDMVGRRLINTMPCRSATKN